MIDDSGVCCELGPGERSVVGVAYAHIRPTRCNISYLYLLNDDND